MKKKYWLFLMITLLLTGCAESNYYTSRDELEVHEREDVDVEKVDDQISTKDEVDTELYHESIRQDESLHLSQNQDAPTTVDDTLKDKDVLIKQKIQAKERQIENINNEKEQNNSSQEIQHEVIVDENIEVKSNEEVINIPEAESDQVEEEKAVDIITFYKDKYGDRVESADQAKGEALLEKIDTDYLISFLNGGLTEEEETVIKSYLHERLTDEEYEEVKELINKYIYLLSDEVNGGI